MLRALTAAALLVPLAASAAPPLAERVKSAIERDIPGARVKILDPMTLKLASGDFEVSISLENTRLACATESACQPTIDTLVRNIKNAVLRQGAAEEVDASRLLLTLKDTAWVTNTLTMIREKRPDKYEDNRLISEPFVAGLSIVLVVDSPDGMRMLQGVDLPKLGLTAEKAGERARKNLRAMFKKLPAMEQMGDTGVWTNSKDENYASALLVLPELWEPLSKKVDGKLVVAAPSRNRLLAAGDGSRDRIQGLSKVVVVSHDQEDHPLTTALLEWTPKGFQARR